MNERIRELELEAIAYADSKVPANDRYNDIYHSIVRGKFAELITKECRSIILRRLGDLNMVEHNNAIWCCWGDIGDELGIEK